MPIRFMLLAVLFFLPSSVPAGPPSVIDKRLVLELVAREPQIVTPTGLTVDEHGRIWVIENNTHQREAKYRGHPSDRIKIFDDLESTGRARRVTTFADGFKNAMSLAFGPDGSLYLATRAEIILLRRNGDRLVDRKTLAKLDTSGTYPHNGLCGFAFDGLGNMYFGMGENLGADYKLIGSDGTTLKGGGEGGNLFRCRPDGTELVRIATGFWNPFHHAFDAFGRLFVVDNDPDSRGPCRLLHIVPGGDYGYRFRYGRKGTHPFQSWDGELPGTLGMVAGTGEAPSGVLAYESTSLPADYRGNLLVTSWGDHTIERYELVPRGASFSARMHTLVRGGEDFRPVAIATGPDGAVYFSDWVDKSYPVHGMGRIWRLRGKDSTVGESLRASQIADVPLDQLGVLLGHARQEIRQSATMALGCKGKAAREILGRTLAGKGDTRTKMHALWAAVLLGKDGEEIVLSALDVADPEVRAEAIRMVSLGVPKAHGRLLKLADEDAAAPARMQAIVRLGEATGRTTVTSVVRYLADPDPFLVSAAVNALGQRANVALLREHASSANSRLRQGVLLALRKSGDESAQEELRQFLADPDPEVRRCAIQWVGEERLDKWAGGLEKAAVKTPTTPALFRSLLAARHLLAGGKPDSDPADEKWLAQVLNQNDQPAVFRVLALRMLRPDHSALAPDRLDKLLADRDPSLRREAARTLASRGGKGVESILLALAKNESTDAALRAEAVLGLSSLTASSAVRQRLFALLDRPELRRDALRSLRGAGHDPDVTRSLVTWWDKADIAESERPELAAQMNLVLKGSKGEAIADRLRQLEKQASPRPTSPTAWQRYLAREGDPTAGERVFFHPNGPGCWRCHRIDGYGANVGPDLSTIGSSMNRGRLVESILQPSKEIAPRYVAWRFVTFDGKQRVGVVVDEGPNSTITLADAEGKQHTIKRQDVEERTALPTSIMPDNLHEQMTPREFRDLIAYLAARTAGMVNTRQAERGKKGR
jgi:putative membrane-bound dehydrogenase-like protein